MNIVKIQTACYADTLLSDDGAGYCRIRVATTNRLIAAMLGARLFEAAYDTSEPSSHVDDEHTGIGASRCTADEDRYPISHTWTAT